MKENMALSTPKAKKSFHIIYDFVSLSNVGEGSIMAYLNGKRVYMDLQGNLKIGDKYYN